jgi:hypothetical protein
VRTLDIDTRIRSTVKNCLLLAVQPFPRYRVEYESADEVATIERTGSIDSVAEDAGQVELDAGAEGTSHGSSDKADDGTLESLVERPLSRQPGTRRYLTTGTRA